MYQCRQPGLSDFGSKSACQVDTPSFIGDSICDADVTGLNTMECGWDGGDCCESTCDGRSSNQCGENAFFCLDPNATETIVVGGVCDVAFTSYLGDGACDIMDTYNTLACNWDGGDCCVSSCTSTTDNTCGVNGWQCLDPDGSSCPVSNPSYLNDGYCDAMDQFSNYNTAGCNWDGGDCCHATCGDNGPTEVECGSYGLFLCFHQSLLLLKLLLSGRRPLSKPTHT